MSALGKALTDKQKNNKNFERYKESYFSSCSWRGIVDAKLKLASPFYFFLTGVKHLPHTFKETLTITFPELLDRSLGKLEHSLHINFMVELPWLLAQYAINDLINPSMTILYGVDDDDLNHVPSHLNVTAVKVKTPNPFGHHHTKMSIFFYSDGSIRFTVYTANLIESDWEDRTQGVWISPICPFLGDGVPINYGESETFFKVDVLDYLKSYNLKEIRKWLIKIQQSDCSPIKVCFLASSPGVKTGTFGYRKLNQLIKEHSTNINGKKEDLIIQCSSIGSLGKTADSWLLGEFAKNLSATFDKSECNVFVIYPSVENVSSSVLGLSGGACLPYSSGTHKQQLWLDDYLMQWKSDNRNRTKAVPHIKTYATISSNGKELFWFLLTSANLSKAAWGRELKSGSLQIMSYEAGVVFFPKFLINKNVFSVKSSDCNNSKNEDFPLPYDLPLTPYQSTDKIFLYDLYY